MNENITCIILGAGGHAAVVADALQLDPKITIAGLLEQDIQPTRQQYMALPILGTDNMLPVLTDQGITHFALGMAGTNNSLLRKQLHEKAQHHNLVPCTVLHPGAIVSPHATISQGAQILAGAIVNPYAKIGCGAILNSGAIVEHHAHIHPFVHIAPRACVCGSAVVGEGAFVGAGAIVLQGIRIGPSAVVAAGAVVCRDVPEGTTVLGVPARPRGAAS